LAAGRVIKSELLLSLPSVPTTNRALAEQVKQLGLAEAVRQLPLLGDSSGDAGWRAWHKAAELPYAPSRSSLTIQNSNSRIQAVVDGQEIVLWDDLVASEFGDGTLVRLSDVRVENAGYFLVFTDQPMSQSAEAFLDWLRAENNRSKIPV
jgi:LysR family glycine cleavage system transcriptional activator